MPGHASPSLVDAEVAERAARIRSRMKRSAEDIIEIGHELAEIKRLLGHGAFAPWLAREFDWSERTARTFMQVAATFGGKSANFAVIAPSALMALAAPSVPDETRERFIEQAERGEPVRFADVREALRPAPAPAPTVLPVEEIEGPPLFPRRAEPRRFAVVDTETGEVVGDAEPMPPVDLHSGRLAATGEGLRTPAQEADETRFRLRRRYLELSNAAGSGLFALDPALVAEVISDDDERLMDVLAGGAAKWFAAVKANRHRGLRMVGGQR